MSSTQLFVYGTLRHDQPEHARFCRGVTGWRPARLRATLWMLPAGYRLATVPSTAMLLVATQDAAADETTRAKLSPTVIGAAAEALEASGAAWLSGEVLSFQDAGAAWPPLDRWEEFTPGQEGCYVRTVVPIETESGVLPIWTYVAPEAPPGSRPVRI